MVPPNQTEMMVEALRRRSIPCGYLLFAGEGHGFRRAENIEARALDAELYFYAELVFKTRLELLMGKQSHVPAGPPSGGSSSP